MANILATLIAAEKAIDDCQSYRSHLHHKELAMVREAIAAWDKRPIERSPAAPAGEVEAAVETAILQEIRLWPALRDALCTMSAECQREFSDEVSRKAAAATRAAQERRLVVEMREACAAVANAEVARHNTGSGFDSSAAYTAACRIEVAIRALPIPGEEEKA